MNKIINFNDIVRKEKQIDQEEVKLDNIKIENIRKLIKLKEYGIVCNIEIICEMDGKIYYLGDEHGKFVDKSRLMERIKSVDGYVNIRE